MSRLGVQDLDHVAEVLSGWQYDGGPLHLHPGDLGWHSLRGAAKTAASLRGWSGDGSVLALGLLDGPDGLLAWAIDPDLRDEDELAWQLADDVDDVQRGVLGAGTAVVEARGAERFSQLLLKHGWQLDEPWTPLSRTFSTSERVDDRRIEEAGLRVETIGPYHVDPWVAVHWSAFKSTPFGEEQRRDFREWWLRSTDATMPSRWQPCGRLAPVDPDWWSQWVCIEIIGDTATAWPSR